MSAPAPSYKSKFCPRGAASFGLHGRAICDVCVKSLVAAWNQRECDRRGVRAADPATLFRGNGRTCADVMRFCPHEPRGAA